MALFIDSGFSAPRSPAIGLGPNPRTGGFTPPPRTVAAPGELPLRSEATNIPITSTPWFNAHAADPSLAIPAGPAPVDPGGTPLNIPGGVDFATDPGYQMALGQQQMGLSQLDATLKAARERAIIGFGDPALAQLAGFGLDPQAGDFARQNYLSGNATLARLDKDKEAKRQAMINALAGHGLLFSGDTGYQEGQQAQQYGATLYDERNKVLDYLRNLDSDTQERKGALRQSVVTALQTAAANAATTGGTGGTQSVPVTVRDPVTGQSVFRAALPAKASMVWDVNSPSTYWGVSSAQQGHSGVVLTEGDPAAAYKFQAAVQNGVPVSIQVNGDANDTPQTLAAKIAQAKAQYPGASITLDLESPNFRGGQGTTNWDAQNQYAQAAYAAAGNAPITVSTEGVSDFNYGAWGSNPNTTFAPQAYNGDMSPRDVNQVAQILISMGIDPSRVIPIIGANQSLGGYTGPVSVYGIPTTNQNPAAPTQAATTSAAAPTRSLEQVLTQRINQLPGASVRNAGRVFME